MSATIKQTGDALKHFEFTLKAFRDGYCRVGVLDGNKAHADSDLSMGALAVVHEFGAPGANVPERSFLRRGLRKAAPKLQKLTGTLSKEMLKKQTTMHLALQKLADVVQEAIRDQFRTRGDGSWPPLSKETVARKGHDVPLIASRQLYESIVTEVKIP